jgi:hypothetical protein
MTHLDVEQIQRLLHGELSHGDLEAVQAHVAMCRDCRLSVERARAEEHEVLDRLGSLDHREPGIGLEAILARASGRKIHWGRWVAGVILALGATSAAYAAPGSPLRAWLEDLVDPAQPAIDTPESRTPPSVSGIAVDPGDRLSIQFSEAQQIGRLILVFTEERQVSVTAQNSAAGFDSDIGRLVVLNEGSEADFHVSIPQAAPLVEVLVSGRVVFLKIGDRVESQYVQDDAGRYIVPLQPGVAAPR